MIWDIYYIGAIIACIIAVIYVFKKISDEEVPLDWVTELSIVIYVIIITLLSWVSILSCVYNYLIDEDEEYNLH